MNIKIIQEIETLGTRFGVGELDRSYAENYLIYRQFAGSPSEVREVIRVLVEKGALKMNGTMMVLPGPGELLNTMLRFLLKEENS